MKGSAPGYPCLAADENTPKHTYTDTKHMHMVMKDTYMSTREDTSNRACIDIESAPLLLLASLMNSPATPAHKYVIQPVLRPRPKDY